MPDGFGRTSTIAIRSLRAGPTAPWTARVWPLLTVGFGLYLGLGLGLIVLGFLVQDRLELDDRATASTMGVVLFVTGLVRVAIQGVLVPRLNSPTVRLLRTGPLAAVVGLLVLAVADSLLTLTAGLVLMAIGLGVAIPRFTAAPTRLATPVEQGRVAGWVWVTTGGHLCA